SFCSQVRRIGARRAPCSRAISRGIGTGEPPSSLPNKDTKSAEEIMKSTIFRRAAPSPSNQN
ncbi:hypothetical protein, partial [Burkholderia thailandensis]|uniref:hypothetical protein n=1 Tax=Burkholderia thailandensis TaxID=57975 RepID=UPI00235F1C1A